VNGLQRPGGERTLQGRQSTSRTKHQVVQWNLRRVLGEASWSYHHRPNVTGLLSRRQKNLALSEEVKTIVWKAQHRLNKRYKTRAARGKNKNQIVMAFARERLGFIWAIATKTENQSLAAGQGGMDKAHATEASSVAPGSDAART
jgi:HEPN domain-containing protein